MKRSWGTECAPAWRAWLDRATEQIFRHPDCGAVERELLDHLEDKATDLMGELWQLTRFLIRAVLVVLAVECLWLLWKFA